MRLAKLAIAVNLFACAVAQADAGLARTKGASVLKVRVTTKSGEQSHGSAVVIGPGKLLTSCHVVRNAHHIELMRGYALWTARLRGGDAERDLCVLAAPEVDAPSAIAGTSTSLRAGDAVYAVGFPGSGPLVVSKGRVEALYAFREARVIQTSAEFAPGESGGALFDAAGRLVGILAFRAPAGGSFHFSVPIDWAASVESAVERGESRSEGQAFFERDPEHWAHFLRAAWYEAKEQWPDLFAACEHWAATEPDNQEPLASMVKAVERLLGSPVSGTPSSGARPSAP